MNAKNLPFIVPPRNVAVEVVRRRPPVQTEDTRLQKLFDLYIECMAGSRS